MNVLEEYYRAPRLATGAEPGRAGSTGFFTFQGVTCFGTTSAVPVAASAADSLHDAAGAVRQADGVPVLPFDLAEVVTCLRTERYVRNAMPTGSTLSVKGLVRGAYYLMRPLMPVAVRRHLQRLALRDWNTIPFPHWPVDTTVDRLLELAAVESMRAAGLDRLPFVWFWPDGHSSAAILTHDVETAAGRDFCTTLMEMEGRHRCVSSFQIVPETRYVVPESFLDSIRSHGCEVCIHGLNHDGHLFRDRATFESRIGKINAYARRFGAVGFRSPVLYRNLEWFDRFEFDYDMTVPNVGHLDPQRGGCCTVMPYFLGHLVELPLTTIQDYSLYNILGDFSLDIWTKQMSAIAARHGLMSFIIHPDYTLTPQTRTLYDSLLAHLARMRDAQGVWVDLPKNVAAWWRLRSTMTVVERDGRLTIEGEGAERAEIAYMILDGSSLRYERPGAH